jgi:hypothetical protein
MPTLKLNNLLKEFQEMEGVPFQIHFNKENTNPLIQKLYLKHLISNGGIPYYRFNPERGTLVSCNDNREIPLPDETIGYSFVILQPTKEAPLELRIGTTNHCLLALGNLLDEEIKHAIVDLNREREPIPHNTNHKLLTFSKTLYQTNYSFATSEEAGLSYINWVANHLGPKIDALIIEKTPPVLAAGDITFSHGKIIRLNDQSGGFNICPKDPQFLYKRICVIAALEAFGLPIEKFTPVLPHSPITVLLNHVRLKPSSWESRLSLLSKSEKEEIQIQLS